MKQNQPELNKIADNIVEELRKKCDVYIEEYYQKLKTKNSISDDDSDDAKRLKYNVSNLFKDRLLAKTDITKLMLEIIINHPDAKNLEFFKLFKNSDETINEKRLFNFIDNLEEWFTKRNNRESGIFFDKIAYEKFEDKTYVGCYAPQFSIKILKSILKQNLI